MDFNFNKYLKSYELIDSGNRKKIEKFGELVLIRPEFSANHQPKLSYQKWKQIADAEFISQDDGVFGRWLFYKDQKEKYSLNYKSLNRDLNLGVYFTKTKHIGIFPEQVINWEYIKENSSKGADNKLLNLFGYTGISSLVGADCGYSVTHVDSIKKVIDYGKINAENSGITNIRWIKDDSMKFVNRDVRRGTKYSCIILDPPAIGKGPKGETWILEKHINPLLEKIALLLEDKCFIILNLYSHSIVNNSFINKLISEYFNDFKVDFNDEVFGLSTNNNKISHGYIVRLKR